jgi:hypothetical protein
MRGANRPLKSLGWALVIIITKSPALHSYLAAFQSAAASAPLAPTRNVPV